MREVYRQKELLHSSFSQILDAVSQFFDISVDELKSPSRKKNLAHARHVAMYLMRELTPASLMEIASELGGRDHTTIIHGYNKIEELVRIEGGQTREEVELLRQLSKL